jgi:hypothetical protein
MYILIYPILLFLFIILKKKTIFMICKIFFKKKNCCNGKTSIKNVKRSTLAFKNS